MNEIQNPYIPPAANVELANPDASFPYFKSWFVFFLIAGVGGFFLGAVLGGVAGAILGAEGVSISTIKIITGVGGFLIGLPISYFTFKWSVGKYLINPMLATIQGSSRA